MYRPPNIFAKANAFGYFRITLATPTTANTATKATPTNSPNIIQRVFLMPTVIPSDIAKLIHKPGEIDTKNHVGMKIAKMEISGIKGVFQLKGMNQEINVKNLNVLAR